MPNSVIPVRKSSSTTNAKSAGRSNDASSRVFRASHEQESITSTAAANVAHVATSQLALEAKTTSRLVVAGNPRKIKSHSKTFTGCVTCKARRVKCDERKPACLRCATTGRVCHYKPPRTIIVEFYDSKRFKSSRESRSFQYYIEKAGEHYSSLRSSAAVILKVLGPQASHVCPPIKYILIAMAAEEEARVTQSLLGKSTEDNEAVRSVGFSHYNNAIKMLVDSRSSSLAPEFILICCLLFSAYEMYHFRKPFSYTHIDAGFKIMRDYRNSNPSGKTRPADAIISDIIEPLFINLAVTGATFDDTFPNQDSYFTHESSLDYDLDIPIFFIDVFGAVEKLDALMKSVLRSTMLPPTSTKLGMARNLRQSLAAYLKALRYTSRLPPEQVGSRFLYESQILMVHQAVITMMLDTLPLDDETIYDQYTPMFEALLSECEGMISDKPQTDGYEFKTLRITLSLIPPLFFIATKCRNSLVRRRAIIALHSIQNRDRAWTSCTASQIARQVVAIEEQRTLLGSGDQRLPTLVSRPRAASRGPVRIKLTSLEFRQSKGTIELGYEVAPFAETCRHETYEMPWAVPEEREIATRLGRKILRANGYAGAAVVVPQIACHCNAKPVE